MGGCAGTDEGAGVDAATRAEAAQLFGPGVRGETTPGAASAREPSGWGILLRHYPGAQAEARARADLERVGELVGRSDLRVSQQRSGAAILLGDYPSADDPRARADLEAVQAITAGGERTRPFARAFLAPPSTIGAGGRPEYDLANVRSSRAAVSAAYTLQVGVYQSDDRREAMEAAEEAVVALRAAGEEAFYFHAPARSLVTIGIFGDSEYDPRSGAYSPRIAELQKRHPYNLVNGRPYRDKGRATWTNSALVEVPE